MCDQLANVQFVEEVRKRPLLYNTGYPEYSRRDLTDAAWEEVGKIVNLTGAACKERWKNLKTVYTRHVKRSLEEPTEKRKKYYLMGHMEFVLPFMKPTAMLNLTNPINAHDGRSSTQQNERSHPESREDSFQGDELLTPLVKCEGAEDGRQPHPESYPGPSSMGRWNQNDSVHGNGEPEYPSFPLNNRGSECDTLEVRRMFLLGLLDEVGTMTDAQMRSFKRKVLKLIDDILES